MDDGWKYNGDVEGVKIIQNNSFNTPAPKPDNSRLVSSSSSKSDAAAGEGVVRLPSPTPTFSSLSQDQAATSEATLSSVSGPDSVSESGEGRNSPQREVSRSQVSLGRLFIIAAQPPKDLYLEATLLTVESSW